jgi:putative two-component system response regulator
VFDALSSDRVYRARMSEPEVERFIRDQRGAQFDPRIVDAFMGAIDDMWRIRRTLR